MKIANYKLHSIPTGIFGLDGGAMFGVVPKTLWSKQNPPDDQNRIDLETRLLLAVSDKYKVLIDTGNGEDFETKYNNPKFQTIFRISNYNLEKHLNKLSLGVDDITHVILTHLHFDHAGGATKIKNGKLVPTFKNAKYYIQKKNLETAKNPNERERASYFRQNFEPLVENNQLCVVEGDKQILNNISVMVFDGHTLGMQAVKIEDQTKTLVFCADLIPTTSHIKLAWGMGYDVDPLKVIREKKEFLESASQKGWHLFFEHDPKVECGQVGYNGRNFYIENIINLEIG